MLAQVLRGINGKMTEEEAKKIIFRLSRKPKHWFADELLLQEAHRVVDWEAKKVHKGKDFDTRCCFTVPSNLNETKMAAQREYFLEHYPKVLMMYTTLIARRWWTSSRRTSLIWESSCAPSTT